MNVSLIEAVCVSLFADIDELRGLYPEGTVMGILRVRELYNEMVRNPSMTDRALVKLDVDRHGVSRPTAYNDLAALKAALPGIGREGREFHRWRAKEMLLETYKVALAKKDVRTMERIASSYARAFQIDKEDDVAVNLAEEMRVPAWVPTDDPSVLGLKRLENRDQRISDLLDELRGKEPEIIDVQYEEADIKG